MAKLKIKKGDKVVVLTGRDKGKFGEVLKAFPRDNKVIVQGINIAKRHTKASQTSGGGIMCGRLLVRSFTSSMSRKTAPGICAVRYSSRALRFMVDRK